LVLFTRLYKDAQSTKHKKGNTNILCVREGDKNVPVGKQENEESLTNFPGVRCCAI
jgi:hypothetical protein